MDASPPEDFMRPEPFPSVSTPVCPVHPLSMDTRPRGHTRGHPEAEDQQEAFDRISGILSTLLQEANNAVKEEYNGLLPFKAAGASASLKSRPLSRLPRPIMLHDRRSNASILSSFEPLSPASSVSTLINDDDDDDDDDGTAVGEEEDLLLHTKKENQPAVSPPLLSPSIHRKRLSLHQQQVQAAVLLPTRRFSAPPRRRDPLAESYKRLDSSMAVVDSLSRDLALEGAEQGQQQQDPQSALRLTALLILPFLHIPHALVTTIFDSLSTSDSKNFAGVLAWGLFFALANVMVNQVIRPKTLTAMMTTVSAAVTPSPLSTSATAATTEPMRYSSPGLNLTHHHTPIYRRRRVIRRPSVYRAKLTVPTSPTSAVLVRSRTQPGESLKQTQQHPILLLRSSQQQQHRPIVKRRNSF